MQFLEEKGMLDEFIDAKLEGDDLRAKWCLLNSASEQIKRIEDKHERRKKEQEEFDKLPESQRLPEKWPVPPLTLDQG